MDWIKTKSGYLARTENCRWSIKRDRFGCWSLFVRRLPKNTVRILCTPWLHVAMGIAERESA